MYKRQASRWLAAHLAASQRDAAQLQSVAHRQHLELVRLTQLAEQTQARREQLGSERATLDAELAELAALAVEAERRLGAAVDIEAALSDGWQLIQARPITTLAAAAVDDRIAA